MTFFQSALLSSASSGLRTRVIDGRRMTDDTAETAFVSSRSDETAAFRVAQGCYLAQAHATGPTLCTGIAARMRRPVLPAPIFLKGFTLVELAVVLIIVALLISGMMLPLSAQMDIRAQQETDSSMSNIRDALLGFAAANGRLPRPATSAADGAENPVPCASDAACTGFVPWATLGVARSDAWEKLFRYSVTPAFTNGLITLASVPNRTVQSRNDLGAPFYLAGDPSCTTPTGCVPAVIFSQGRERWGTTTAGNVLSDGSATNVDEDANEVGPTAYFSRQATLSTDFPGGEFDDALMWLSPNLLYNRMIAAGKLP